MSTTFMFCFLLLNPRFKIPTRELRDSTEGRLLQIGCCIGTEDADETSGFGTTLSLTVLAFTDVFLRLATDSTCCIEVVPLSLDTNRSTNVTPPGSVLSKYIAAASHDIHLASSGG
jgi:hypothetical protein